MTWAKSNVLWCKEQLNSDCSFFLSRNDSTFTYRETNEEYLFNLIRRLVVQQDVAYFQASSKGIRDDLVDGDEQKRTEILVAETAALKAEVTKAGQEKHADVHRLLYHSHSCRLLMCLSRFGRHFRSLRELKMSWMVKNLFNTYGGVGH